jgi:hypothetical protein
MQARSATQQAGSEAAASLSCVRVHVPKGWKGVSHTVLSHLVFMRRSCLLALRRSCAAAATQAATQPVWCYHAGATMLVMAVVWGSTCIAAMVWVVNGTVYSVRTLGPGLQAQTLCPPARARGPMALALRLVYDGFVCLFGSLQMLAFASETLHARYWYQATFEDHIFTISDWQCK